MAGAAVDRELSAAARARFSVATRADDAAIRRLLRENPMAGSVSMTMEREPDYFLGANLAGAEDKTIVASADGRIACIGRCSRRLCWIDGLPTQVGYLAELRLDSSAQGNFRVLRDGYRFFQDLECNDYARLYFTSIGAENERARRLLERGAPGMPRYSFLAELTTLLIAVPRRPRASSLDVSFATESDIPELLRVLNAHGKRHQLAAVWTAEALHDLTHRGLPLERYRLLRNHGELIACGALWDQRGFRQTVIQRYSRCLAAAYPLVNLAHTIFGTPRLPTPGVPLPHAFLSPLAFAEEADDVLAEIIETFFPLASQLGVEFLTLVLPGDDPRLPILRRRFSTRSWSSNLYRVDWPDQTPFALDVNATPFLPDAALL